jgi:hypothetical protein
VGEIKDRVFVLAGAVALSLVGRDKFYHRAQSGSGLIGRVARAFCEGHAARVAQNYAVYLEDKDRDRMSAIAQKYYGDDSLHGYGDADFDRSDGKPLVQQDRGLIIPVVEKFVESENPKVVLEIGAANGDVIAHIAQRHPETQFVGVDLSVKNASLKHRSPNLRFVDGYALDLLEEKRIAGDLVFAASTFCVAPPKEFRRYLAAMQGVKRIIIKDPVTFGNEHTGDTRAWSRHMDLYMWFHNYYGYLREYGFDVDHYETRRFVYSWNPNARVLVICGHRS